MLQESQTDVCKIPRGEQGEPKLDAEIVACHSLNTKEEERDNQETGLQYPAGSSSWSDDPVQNGANSTQTSHGERDQQVSLSEDQQVSLSEDQQVSLSEDQQVSLSEDLPDSSLTHDGEEDNISNTFDFEVEIHTSNSSQMSDGNLSDFDSASASNHMTLPGQRQNLHCVECKTTYKTALSYEVHQRWHSVQRPYECIVCRVTFQRAAALQAHLQWHELERPFVCVQCSLAFTQAWTLSQHMKKHMKCHYQCSTCGDRFAHRSDLKLHERRHTEYPYGCDVCDALFMVRYYLKIHMLKHTKSKPWKCRYCKAIFVERTSMDIHREERHPTTYLL